MHGPTCNFWANLTPFSLKRAAAAYEEYAAVLDATPGHAAAARGYVETAVTTLTTAAEARSPEAARAGELLAAMLAADAGDLWARPRAA